MSFDAIVSLINDFDDAMQTEFGDAYGWPMTNDIAHLVFEDQNIDDGCINYQLQYIAEHRDEFRRDYHTKHIDEIVDRFDAFLRLLLCIPESERDDPRWDEDGSDD
jgi:hypothetical protein